MPSETDVRIAEIWEAAQATGYEFEVPRWIDGEPVTVCVGCHELTKDDVASLSSIERGIYHRERARWAKVEAECERLAAEADPSGIDDPWRWRDGEAATLNGESCEETEAECAAQAAE